MSDKNCEKTEKRSLPDCSLKINYVGHSIGGEGRTPGSHFSEQSKDLARNIINADNKINQMNSLVILGELNHIGDDFASKLKGGEFVKYKLFMPGYGFREGDSYTLIVDGETDLVGKNYPVVNRITTHIRRNSNDWKK